MSELTLKFFLTSSSHL